MAIYQEKNKNKWTKDGRSWYFRCYYTNINGNRVQKESKLFKTKKEAQEEEITFLNKISNNENIEKDISFSTVYSEWLEIKKSKVKITSYYKINSNLRKNIYIYFKNYKMKDISLSVLKSYQNNLEKMNLSVDYKNILISYLKDILKYASIDYNFNAKLIDKLYKFRNDIPKEENTIKENFWTYDEFNRFITVVDNDFYYTLFNFLYYTGLRFGEMLALNWNDIDFINKKIKITKSLSNKIENQKYIITTPKTKNSIREIDLDDSLLQILIEHKNRENKIINFSNEMFVFGNINYVSATTFRRYLKKYADKAKVKLISPHGFRHSHVSLLIHLGCDSRDVAARVGDTVNMIETTYYHMFPDKKNETIDKLNYFKMSKNQ